MHFCNFLPHANTKLRKNKYNSDACFYCLHVVRHCALYIDVSKMRVVARKVQRGSNGKIPSARPLPFLPSTFHFSASFRPCPFAVLLPCLSLCLPRPFPHIQVGVGGFVKMVNASSCHNRIATVLKMGPKLEHTKV